jgi:UDPglucose 6-dehydrogenase
MKNITVIGTGYVGLVSGACLADFGNTIICVDSDSDKIMKLKNGDILIFEPGLNEVVERNIKAGRLKFTTDIASSLKQSDVVFIAVGTPPTEDGSADLQYVKQVADQIGHSLDKYIVVVNKSTVPIGTGQKIKQWISEKIKNRGIDISFDVVSNPEFLREGSAVYDFTHPDRVVIGAESEHVRNIMKDVYRSLYLNETPFIETNLESAEMIKYASNAFLAVKITFINEIANLCEKTGADIRSVAKAMGKDGRIGAKFLHPSPGYGGSCFPKDTRALAKIGRENGEVQNIVEATIDKNERQKIRAAKKVETVLGSLSGKTICVLGLSFKQNTDDMRESPAITICEYFSSCGARLRLFDPVAIKEARLRFKSIENIIYYANDVYDAVKGTDALVILTEWNQFRNIDLMRVKELMVSSYFFDFRNIYKPDEVTSAGLKYFCTG